MDEKQIRRKVNDTLLRALNASETSLTADSISMQDCKLDLDGHDKNVHLKVAAGFAKNHSAGTSSIKINRNLSSETLSVEMVYQNRPIGEIEIIVRDRSLDMQQIRSVFEQVAIEMTFFIKRQQVHKQLEDNRNLSEEWIGHSESSKQVDQFVERASSVDFPVLIHGELGSGKLLTAYSIHCHSRRKNHAFIESHCGNWQELDIVPTMRSLWSKASGGTLYLRDIDSLNDEQIAKIRHYWRNVVSADKMSTLPGSTRIIASVSADASHTSSSPWHELDYLSITLPSLRERRDDIKELTEHYFNKLSYIKNVQLSADCWNLFERFEWAGNIQELERVVSKIVVMSDSDYLEPNSLLAIIPQLKDDQGQQIELDKELSFDPLPKLNLAALTNAIVDTVPIQPMQLHPALEKAVIYLAENYTQDISLKKISEIAFVSPSHLSYLFKHHLNTTFKQLLISTRVKKAQQLLIQKRHAKVTEIAYDVGFNDLSHFEKTFKRIVGISPGGYRK